MLNIQLTGRALVAIPGANVFTFLKGDNKLYRGHELVTSFKGAKIPTPPGSMRPPIPRGNGLGTRSYATWTRLLPPTARLLRFLR